MSIKAMKQALEALNKNAWAAPRGSELEAAYIALREAIEQAEQMKPDIADIIAGKLKVSRGTAYDMMREALKETTPVQEPAFHGFMDEEDCCVHICYTPWAPGGPNNELPTAYYTSPLNPLDSIKSSKTLDAQPQREWVGLTDAEIEEFDYYARDLVMDIEKALKEKNNVT